MTRRSGVLVFCSGASRSRGSDGSVPRWHRHDLTHVQFVLLASLWWLEDHAEPPGAPTQAGLAAHAGTDPMMTSQVLRKLEARSLIRRDLDATDARARRLSLTAGGRARLAAALADVEAADAEYFAPAAERLPALLDALAALADAGGSAG